MLNDPTPLLQRQICWSQQCPLYWDSTVYTIINVSLYNSLLLFSYSFYHLCNVVNLHLALERVSSSPALIGDKPNTELGLPPPLPLTPRSIKSAWNNSTEQIQSNNGNSY